LDLTAIETAGALLGTAAASFFASWLSIARPLKRQIAESEPSAKVDLLVHRVQQAEIRLDKICDKADANEDRVGRMVTDEEFAAYSNHTTKAVQNLTEKVGHVTGALEAWYRQPGKHQ
jgi:hypothetical protein